MTRLHVNVDHVATLRQARGINYPDPIPAMSLCEIAGASGITIHLREDRRHITDRDLQIARQVVTTVLNLEMAATDEMVGIAGKVLPDICTLVPEKREERTTEGGLAVAGDLRHDSRGETPSLRLMAGGTFAVNLEAIRDVRSECQCLLILPVGLGLQLFLRGRGDFWGVFPGYVQRFETVLQGPAGPFLHAYFIEKHRVIALLQAFNQ